MTDKALQKLLKSLNKPLKEILFEKAAQEIFKSIPPEPVGTHQMYRTSLKHLIPYFQGKKLSEIDFEGIEGYKEWRKGGGCTSKAMGEPGGVKAFGRRPELSDSSSLSAQSRYRDSSPCASTTKSNATVNRDLAVLSKILHVYKDKGYIREVPKIRMLKETNRVRALTSDETSKLLSECSSSLRMAVEIALATGLRRANVFSLKWKDVETGRITLQVKGNKTHTIPITESLQKKLEEFRRSRMEITPEIFPEGDRYERKFKEARERAGLDKEVVFHTLRHSAAGNLLRATHNLALVKLFLGHSSISTTMKYVHLDTNDLEEGMKKMEERHG